MKRKLKTVLFLTTLLLLGIIAVQGYWSFSAYKLNKEKFDGDINTVMERALDSCKKDYFDSIRVVMVKRLSGPGTHIRLDTTKGQQDTVHTAMSISISNNYVGMGEPFHTTIPQFNHYRQKIDHKPTIPEIITEMSFYVPRLLDEIMLIFGMEDTFANSKKIDAYVKAHSNIPRDSIFAHTNIVQSGTFGFPPNYRQADSTKLHRYFDRELSKMHRFASFYLKISDQPVPPYDPGSRSQDKLRYSETNEYIYKYHGFLFLQHSTKDQLYVRAVFDKPQIGLLKEMVMALGASGVLIVFTIICFFYIIRTLVQQKKLTELKDDFINNMTHELKTPIATITVAIEGLQKFNGLNDPDKTQRYLQTSRNELGRLNQLVSKVLNVAAFESKQVTIAKEKIDVDEMMNELIAAEKQKADKEIEISYVNSGGIKEIEADRMHFRNVMLNLVDNAIKYSTEPVKISITLTKHGKKARFAVKDNGMGIPASHLIRVFDKFHRVPAGNVHNVKGTGLGLNYVKYIVEAHGGTVNVSSEVNKGSEFTITMPIKNG